MLSCSPSGDSILLTFPTQLIEIDLQMAEKFFQSGEIGKSRVCARKAAGRAARYWLLMNIPDTPPTIDLFQALTLLKQFCPKENIDQTLLDNLLMKVDFSYNMPDHIDLIYAAKSIISQIQGAA